MTVIIHEPSDPGIDGPGNRWKGNIRAFKGILSALENVSKAFQCISRRFGVFIFVSNAIGNKYKQVFLKKRIRAFSRILVRWVWVVGIF